MACNSALGAQKKNTGAPALSARLKVRRVRLESLHLDPANARLHGAENLDAITASLVRFG